MEPKGEAQVNKEDRRQEWMGRLADYRASGLSMRAWCEVNQINFHQLRYWIRSTKKREAIAAHTTSFVPLTVSDAECRPSGASLVVRIGGAQIELQPGFNPQLLRDIVQALEGTPC